MKFRKCVVIVLSLLSSIWIVRASQQENGIAALKTADGFLLIWNQPDIHFTIEIKGKEIRPMNSTEHVFFNVDGMVVQVQSAAISEFIKDNKKPKPDEKSILTAHLDWETQFIESGLGKTISVQLTPQKLSDGSEALYWKFDMPEGLNAEAKKQLFVTRVSNNHVLVLNGVVTKTVEEERVRKFLTDTISTLKISSNPINVQELQEAIRKGKPK